MFNLILKNLFLNIWRKRKHIYVNSNEKYQKKEGK